MYLVTLGTTLDDLPLRLFEKESDACVYAGQVWSSFNDPDADLSDVETAVDVSGRDPATVLGVQVWQFSPAGKLVRSVCTAGF